MVERKSAPGRNRTYGLALRRRTLYPLSYRRVETILPAEPDPVGYAGADGAPRADRHARVPRAVRHLARRPTRTPRSSRSRSRTTASSATARARRTSATTRGPRRRTPGSSSTCGRCSATTRSRRARSSTGWRELPGQMAAKCAVDGALHDLLGKICGQPLWRILGLDRTPPPTSYTISIDTLEGTADRARRAAVLSGAQDQGRRPGRPRAGADRPRRGAGRAHPRRRERGVDGRRRPSSSCRSSSRSGWSSSSSRSPPPTATATPSSTRPACRSRSSLDESCHTLARRRARRGHGRRDQHQAHQVGRHPRGACG